MEYDELDDVGIGDSVIVEHHSDGIGLGGGYRDMRTTGEVEAKSERELAIRDNQGVLTYVPIIWLDSLTLID